MEFSCYRKECPYEGKGSYILTIPQEACVDEHNCATFFCPFCNGELTKLEPDNSNADIQNRVV